MSSRHQAARNLADAQMTQPALLTEDEVVALKIEFSAAELVELSLDVMKWNYQKVSVALGTDGEVRPGELVALSFDEGGSAVLD